MFSNAPGTFTNIDQMFEHKKNLIKFLKIEISPSMTSNNSGKIFYMNKYDIYKPPHILKLKGIILNNHDSKKKSQE